MADYCNLFPLLAFLTAFVDDSCADALTFNASLYCFQTGQGESYTEMTAVEQD